MEQTRWPGRATEIRRLKSLLHGNRSGAPVFVYGPSECGKTEVVRHVVSASQADCRSFVNCVECFTPQLLMSAALYDLGCLPDPSANVTIQTFLYQLRQSFNTRTNRTAVVVFDGVERLREWSIPVLPVLCSMDELSDIRDPVIVSFPGYSQVELVAVLQRMFLNEAETSKSDILGYTDAFGSWCESLVGALYPVSRRISELWSAAREWFPTYLDPVLRGEVESTNHSELIQRMGSKLKELAKGFGCRSNGMDDVQRHSYATPLPVLAKYVLTAAFLCSYNPAKVDSHFFSSAGTEKKRRTRRNADMETADKSEVGKTSSFTLERILAVTAVLYDGGDVSADDVLVSLASLHAMNLILGPPISISHSGRYRCIAPLEMVTDVAASISIELDRYMYSAL